MNLVPVTDYVQYDGNEQVMFMGKVMVIYLVWYSCNKLSNTSVLASSS